jgi:hypothetical protein
MRRGALTAAIIAAGAFALMLLGDLAWLAVAVIVFSGVAWILVVFGKP